MSQDLSTPVQTMIDRIHTQVYPGYILGVTHLLAIQVAPVPVFFFPDVQLWVCTVQGYQRGGVIIRREQGRDYSQLVSCMIQSNIDDVKLWLEASHRF